MLVERCTTAVSGLQRSSAVLLTRQTDPYIYSKTSIQINIPIIFQSTQLLAAQGRSIQDKLPSHVGERIANHQQEVAARIHLRTKSSKCLWRTHVRPFAIDEMVTPSQLAKFERK